MRTTGTLLTVLALLAVQAPWIACACDGNAAFTPLLAGVLVHGADTHEHGDDHAHTCCDAVAHAVHGADHSHGRHCHGVLAHTHEGEDPEAPTERHDGFSLALRTLPTDVGLDAAEVVPALFTALLEDATWSCSEARTVAAEPEPPERPGTPPAATERRLL